MCYDRRDTISFWKNFRESERRIQYSRSPKVFSIRLIRFYVVRISVCLSVSLKFRKIKVQPFLVTNSVPFFEFWFSKYYYSSYQIKSYNSWYEQLIEKIMFVKLIWTFHKNILVTILKYRESYIMRH